MLLNIYGRYHGVMHFFGVGGGGGPDCFTNFSSTSRKRRKKMNIYSQIPNIFNYYAIDRSSKDEINYKTSIDNKNFPCTNANTLQGF